MKIKAASLHRLVVNARIFQNVKSLGAEFHANQQYLAMFSSDPTTMITDTAQLEGEWDKPSKWFWSPEKLKEFDLSLRDWVDETIVNLDYHPGHQGDFQRDTYLNLLDPRFYHSGGGEFVVWGDRLRKLNLIKPAGEYPIGFTKVLHTGLNRDMLTFRVGPTVRGIVTIVEKE